MLGDARSSRATVQIYDLFPMFSRRTQCACVRSTVNSTVGYLSFELIEKNTMVFVTSVRARRTGAASQAFERMHNTLSHKMKTEVPGGMQMASNNNVFQCVCVLSKASLATHVPVRQASMSRPAQAERLRKR